MLTNIWTVLCKRAIEDVRTHNVSLIEGISQAKVTRPVEVEEPFSVWLDFVLASLWRNDDKDNTFELMMQLLSPAGSILTEAKQIDVSVKEKQSYKWFVGIRGIEMPGEGVYKFKVRHKESGGDRWRHGATTSLLVTFEYDDQAPQIYAKAPDA